MEIVKTDIDGVVIIEPKIFWDDRGYFYESFSAREFADKVNPNVAFVQDNQSFSSYGVLRGLHFQKPPHAQSKLVRVIEGSVIDVAVDIRKGSPKFGKYVSVELTGENHRQFFIPKGFAHGFVVVSETALFQYKCDNPYVPNAEGAIIWNDPDINIDWGISEQEAKLSAKDKLHGLLMDFDSPFIYGDY